MRTPILRIIRQGECPQYAKFKEHLKLCSSCREAINETDLCIEGLDLWLDKFAVTELLEKYRQ